MAEATNPLAGAEIQLVLPNGTAGKYRITQELSVGDFIKQYGNVVDLSKMQVSIIGPNGENLGTGSATDAALRVGSTQNATVACAPKGVGGAAE